MHADKGEPSGLKGGNINIKKKTKQQKQHQLSLICDEIYREILFHDGNERVCAHWPSRKSMNVDRCHFLSTHLKVMIFKGYVQMKSHNCWLRKHVKTSHLHIPALSPIPTSQHFCKRSAAQSYLTLKAVFSPAHKRPVVLGVCICFVQANHAFFLREKLEMKNWNCKLCVINIWPRKIYYHRIYFHWVKLKLSWGISNRRSPISYFFVCHTTCASSIQAIPAISSLLHQS